MKNFISEKPKFFGFIYTNPNMSFLFTAEYCSGLTLSGYNISQTFKENGQQTRFDVRCSNSKGM